MEKGADNNYFVNVSYQVQQLTAILPFSQWLYYVKLLLASFYKWETDAESLKSFAQGWKVGDCQNGNLNPTVSGFRPVTSVVHYLLWRDLLHEGYKNTDVTSTVSFHWFLR